MLNPELERCTIQAREFIKYAGELCFRACSTERDVQEMMALICSELSGCASVRLALRGRPDPMEANKCNQ